LQVCSRKAENNIVKSSWRLLPAKAF